MQTSAQRTRGIKHISTYIDVFDAVFQSSDIAKRMKSLNVCLLFHSDCQHESKAHQVIWMPCLKIIKTAVLLYMNLSWNYSNLQMINPINWPCLCFFFSCILDPTTRNVKILHRVVFTDTVHSSISSNEWMNEVNGCIHNFVLLFSNLTLSSLLWNQESLCEIVWESNLC